MTETDPRTPVRVRHNLGPARHLKVVSKHHLSPNMIRIVLGGDDLTGFTSLGFDDHVKVFFPDPVTGEIATPVLGPDGIRQMPEGQTVIARDYTPRAYDRTNNHFTLDFAVHEAGPATTWAQTAKVGDELRIGGPRGSFVVPLAFDGYVLIGDETALPAIGRRLEELPVGAKAVVLVEVESETDQLSFDTPADVTIHWVYRSEGQTLSEALKAIHLPSGDCYAWVACESATAKALRIQLIRDHGINPKWLKAAGYWRLGAVAAHDTIED
jgi:NADPH-dependent ferric siderophore reductase